MRTANPGAGVTADADEFDYTYDGASNRATETRITNSQTSRMINYSYDEIDRLTAASYVTSGSSGGSSTTNTLNYGYDAVGNRMSVSGTDVTGAAVNLTSTYDELNRLLGQSGDPAGVITFTYDDNGNLASRAQAGQTTTYSYDGRDQLRSVTGPGGSQVASYDYDFQRRRYLETLRPATRSIMSMTETGLSTSTPARDLC